MASINLASKFSGKIAERFTKESFVAGHTSNDYDFAGVKTISIYTPQTVDLNDYVRSGMNRFGTPVEMGDTVQELALSQDKSFSLTIDRGNNIDQMNTKGAAKMLKMQIKEQVVPYMDKYALRQWAMKAGTVKGITAPDKTTIVGAIFDGAAALDNLLVPDDKRVLYLPTTYYNLLRQSAEFLAVDSLAEKALSKGYVGMIADMQVIKVPDSYLEGIYFLITYTGSVLMPNKIKTARILDEVQGIDGNVLEGRNYFDAFVLSAKAGGVYAAVPTASVTPAPVASITSGEATITSVASTTFYYTVDGSDPRYSKSAQVYSAKVAVAEGETFKCYGLKEGAFPSAVTTASEA